MANKVDLTLKRILKIARTLSIVTTFAYFLWDSLTTDIAGKRRELPVESSTQWKGGRNQDVKVSGNRAKSTFSRWKHLYVNFARKLH